MPPKPFPTHFLCIPLVNASSRTQLSQGLAAFAADVTAEESLGIPRDAIRPVGTLHLTLGVCSFPRDEGLDRATDLLKSLRLRAILESARRQVAARALPGETNPAAPTVREAYGSNVSSSNQEMDNNSKLSPRQGTERGGEDEEEGEAPPQQPLLIALRGLASMQTPSKTSVLYARPADDQGEGGAGGVLQAFCEKLRAVFLDAGLVQDDSHRPLLLHATVLNTIYAKKEKKKKDAAPGEEGAGGAKRRGRGGRRGEKLTFDAWPVIDRYEGHVWMEGFAVEKVALCRMGAKKVVVAGVVEDEAYEAVTEVEF